MLRWKEKRGSGGRDVYKINLQATSHLSGDDEIRQKREVEAVMCYPDPLRTQGFTDTPPAARRIACD